MLGQGCLKTKTPSTSLFEISWPVTGSNIAGAIPKKGRDALPGLTGVTPARGVMACDPVSVWKHAGDDGTAVPGRTLEQPERRGGGIKMRHAVPAYDVPVARKAWVRRGALENDRGDAQKEGAIDAIGMAGDPTKITAAKITVAVVHVECVFCRHCRAQEISSRAVQHPLGLSGRARGVQQEERIFGIHHLGCDIRRPFFQLFVPPQIATRREGYVGSARSLVNKDVCNMATMTLQCVVHDSLEADGLAATSPFICSDDDFGSGIQDAVA
ncbi:hypothetical protein PspLS_09528 [Pyricularia sp. CBS 133598]|nr:hypothetical protein PspLS_09528 [Pyricularia sp. CBS 133598]